MNRLGLTVSTKLGTAVRRNRIRRRYKEIYRTNEEKFDSGYDIVIVARSKSRLAPYRELEADFLGLMKRLGASGTAK
jgi:ribonuclease P protein component